eukprot:jgi/Chrzof1/7479/Cz02g25140.t1
MFVNQQGLARLSNIGQDLTISNNPRITSLADLPHVLQVVGSFHSGDIRIAYNPQLNSLGGLGAAPLVTVRGHVHVHDNGAIPAAEATLLQSKAAPVSMDYMGLATGAPYDPSYNVTTAYAQILDAWAREPPGRAGIIQTYGD